MPIWCSSSWRLISAREKGPNCRPRQRRLYSGASLIQTGEEWREGAPHSAQRVCGGFGRLLQEEAAVAKEGEQGGERQRLVEFLPRVSPCGFLQQQRGQPGAAAPPPELAADGIGLVHFRDALGINETGKGESGCTGLPGEPVKEARFPVE